MYRPTESEIAKWKKDLLLTPEDIQESAEDDESFQHSGALKLQCRAMLEWFNSPCIEHTDKLSPKLTHGQCSKCMSIAYMAVKT